MLSRRVIQRIGIGLVRDHCFSQGSTKFSACTRSRSSQLIQTRFDRIGDSSMRAGTSNWLEDCMKNQTKPDTATKRMSERTSFRSFLLCRLDIMRNTMLLPNGLPTTKVCCPHERVTGECSNDACACSCQIHHKWVSRLKRGLCSRYEVRVIKYSLSVVSFRVSWVFHCYGRLNTLAPWFGTARRWEHARRQRLKCPLVLYWGNSGWY